MKAESIINQISKILPLQKSSVCSRCFYKLKTGDNHVYKDKIKCDLLRCRSKNR